MMAEVLGKEHWLIITPIEDHTFKSKILFIPDEPGSFAGTLFSNDLFFSGAHNNIAAMYGYKYGYSTIDYRAYAKKVEKYKDTSLRQILTEEWAKLNNIECGKTKVKIVRNAPQLGWTVNVSIGKVFTIADIFAGFVSLSNGFNYPYEWLDVVKDEETVIKVVIGLSNLSAAHGELTAEVSEKGLKIGDKTIDLKVIKEFIKAKDVISLEHNWCILHWGITFSRKDLLRIEDALTKLHIDI